METKVCKNRGRELPLSEFHKRHLGYDKCCKQCYSENRKQKHEKKKNIDDMERQLTEAKQARLNDFTPLELMLELKRRGYQGTLIYIEEHRIDLDKLT